MKQAKTSRSVSTAAVAGASYTVTHYVFLTGSS